MISIQLFDTLLRDVGTAVLKLQFTIYMIRFSIDVGN